MMIQRLIIAPILFSLFSLTVACSNEPLTEDPVASTPTEPTQKEPVQTNGETPCDFNLTNLGPNDTVIIDCLLDLDGQTFNIPSGVTIEYQPGGDIINGTLNFSDGGIISGELLNASLKLTGSTPRLKNTTFKFIAERWEIVQGTISDMVAYDNKIIFNKVLEVIQKMGASTVLIDNLDAYFQTQPNFILEKQTPQDAALQVPANLKLIMTENTHLRVQPNNYKNTVLLTLFKADNSSVTGGFMHGDRDTHDYSDGGTHEWGHLILIKASKNVVVEGVNLIDAGGDGVEINALGHAYDSFYTPCDNILVKGNKIVRSRRNGLGLTDGRNIIIEGNEFVESGVSTSNSIGVAPQWALDIEPVWSNGTKFEIVEHVIIRNNIERGSEKGGFINARGYYITYEGNHMENTLAMGETVGSIVRNNTFENPGKNSKVAIAAGMNDPLGYGNERNHDNQVYGNNINGFDKGIFLQDPGIDLHDNTIINCLSGIQILNSRDSKIRNNTIINEISNSEGIGNKVSDYINNVDIYDNVIKVVGSPFRFTEVNRDEANQGYRITIRNNEVTSVGNNNSSFNKIRGFDFQNNLCHNSGIRVVDASDGNIFGNTFENGVIRISQGCSDLVFSDNLITGGNCFYEDNTDALNVVKTNNTCN